MTVNYELPKEFKTWLAFYDYLSKSLDHKFTDQKDFEKPLMIVIQEQMKVDITNNVFPEKVNDKFYYWEFIKTKALNELNEDRFTTKQVVEFNKVFHYSVDFTEYRNEEFTGIWDKIYNSILNQSKK